MKFTKQEQETIVLFNEDESTAEIYTYNTKLRNRLLRLRTSYPMSIDLHEDKNGATIAKLSKNLLTVSVHAPYSQQERQARSQRAKQSANLLNFSPSSERIEQMLG